MNPQQLFKKLVSEVVPSITEDREQKFLALALIEAIKTTLLADTYFQDGPGAEDRFSEFRTSGQVEDMATLIGYTFKNEEIESEAGVYYPERIEHAQDIHLPVKDIITNWFSAIRRFGLDKSQLMAAFSEFLWGTTDKQFYKNGIQAIAQQDVLPAKWSWLQNKYTEMCQDLSDELFEWPDETSDHKAVFTWAPISVNFTDVAFASDRRHIRLTIQAIGSLKVKSLTGTFDKDQMEMDRLASLKGKVIRLAHAKPELRSYLLPLLRK